MAIDGISSGLSGVAGVAAPGASSNSDAPGFGDTLRQLIGEVETTAGDANTAVGRMIDGTGDVHEAMIALQKADVMFQLTMQIRNKIVQAYQDVMRMPV